MTYLRTKFLTLFMLLSLSFSLSGCLPVIMAGGASSGLDFAKDRSTEDTLKDKKISSAIKLRFIRDGFSKIYAKTKIEVIKGHVLLTGIVEKPKYVRKAVSICWEEEGVVEVINEIKVDEKSTTFDIAQYTRDSLITSHIRSRIILDPIIKSLNYTVITEDRVVYLFGLARSKEELESVANIAASVKGVTKVVSHVMEDDYAKERRASRLAHKRAKNTSSKEEQQQDDEDDDQDDE